MRAQTFRGSGQHVIRITAANGFHEMFQQVLVSAAVGPFLLGDGDPLMAILPRAEISAQPKLLPVTGSSAAFP